MARKRATEAEMEERYQALIEISRAHQPCTVRQVYYRAVVAALEGITKDRRGYEKVQDALKTLRENGRLPYSWIVDTSRSVYALPNWASLGDYVAEIADRYRRDLWQDAPIAVQVWCESESIASTIWPTCAEWQVPLFPTRGQVSLSYAKQAVGDWSHHRDTAVLYIGDHDPSGLDIDNATRHKLEQYSQGRMHDFRRLAVTREQIEDLDLPGTPAKIRSDKQAARFPWDEAVETEALPPDYLRALVSEAIGEYADADARQRHLDLEEEERERLEAIADNAA